NIGRPPIASPRRWQRSSDFASPVGSRADVRPKGCAPIIRRAPTTEWTLARMTDTTTTAYSKVDVEALQLAMDLQQQRGVAFKSQIRLKLEDEDFHSVAQFAASSLQSANLELKPWEMAPCNVDEDEDYGEPTYDHQKLVQAQALLRKMLKAGI